MGSRSVRLLVFLSLLCSCLWTWERRAMGETAPSIEELCRLPASTPRAPVARAEREALLRRAAAAFDRDQYAESLIALHSAYAAEPGADILFNMGQACFAAKRLEDALALYLKAQSESTSPETTARITSRLDQLKPRLAKALTLKAILLGSQEKYAESCAVWSRAYDLDPRPLYLLQLADALRQAGRHDEALALYERLLSLPDAGDIVGVARRRITELREQSAASAPPAAPVPTPPPTQIAPVPELPVARKERIPAYRKWWFWTALGGAALTVGLAVGLGTKAALDSQPSYPDLRRITF